MTLTSHSQETSQIHSDKLVYSSSTIVKLSLEKSPFMITLLLSLKRTSKELNMQYLKQIVTLTQFKFLWDSSANMISNLMMEEMDFPEEQLLVLSLVVWLLLWVVHILLTDGTWKRKLNLERKWKNHSSIEIHSMSPKIKMMTIQMRMTRMMMMMKMKMMTKIMNKKARKKSHKDKLHNSIINLRLFNQLKSKLLLQTSKSLLKMRKLNKNNELIDWWFMKYIETYLKYFIKI